MIWATNHNESNIACYFISDDLTRAILHEDHSIGTRANRLAFTLLRGGRAICPPKQPLRSRASSHASDVFLSMPVFVEENNEGVYPGIKWLGSRSRNHLRGLPRSTSTIILNNPVDGTPVAIFDGTWISIYRTASLAEILIRSLLESHPRVGIVGFGRVCRELVRRISHDVDVTVLQNPYLSPKFSPKTASNIENMLMTCDLVVTATTSKVPIIQQTNGRTIIALSLNDVSPSCISTSHEIYTDDKYALWSGSKVFRECFVSYEGEGFNNRVKEFDLDKIDEISYGALIVPRGLAIQDVTLASLVFKRIKESGRVTKAIPLEYAKGG